MHHSVDDCVIIELPIVHTERGNITVLEKNGNIPLQIKRVYYLYDVPMGAERGGHAHYQLQQYVVAASGSFIFLLDDGKNKKEVFLNHPNKALHIVPGIWREMKDFSSGAICLVLASHQYNEQDYIRDYEEFLKYRLSQSAKLENYNEYYLKKSWEWLNDPEIKHLTNTNDFTYEQQQNWFANLKIKAEYKIWGASYNDRPIGVFGIKNLTADTGEYWGYIGEKAEWGKGLGTIFMERILLEAKKINLGKLYLKVIEDNKRAIKLYKKMGFEFDGIENGLIKMVKVLK